MNQHQSPPSDHVQAGALDILKKQPEQNVLPQTFRKVDRFTTFLAEYCFKDDDLIIHFFPSVEAHKSKNARGYWYQTFPSLLEAVAKKYFDADFPKIQAERVDGVIPSPNLEWPQELRESGGADSWFLAAAGYGDRLDPVGFAERFFKSLDDALEATKLI